jgi:hypothetical protein
LWPTVLGQIVKEKRRNANRCREIVTAVDWDCEVLTNFAETNLGCAERVISGLTWAFEQIESAIILEDDCFPGNDFFRFCEALIPRYKDDDRIGLITGDNFGGAVPNPTATTSHISPIFWAGLAGVPLGSAMIGL